MKTFLTLCVLFFSSYVIAESYECTHELSRFDRPGEYETLTFTRYGDVFMMEGIFELSIAKDTEEILMLILINTDLNLFFNTIINKKTKEYTQTFTSIEDAKKYENTGLVYGKCKILK
tara:strand:- start:401 stop:754 length:354 start_codon:yes stop_codon:yes gene_type:complete